MILTERPKILYANFPTVSRPSLLVNVTCSHFCMQTSARKHNEDVNLDRFTAGDRKVSISGSLRQILFDLYYTVYQSMCKPIIHTCVIIDENSTLDRCFATNKRLDFDMSAILYSLDTYHCKYDTMSKFNAIFVSYNMNKALDKYYTYNL